MWRFRTIKYTFIFSWLTGITYRKNNELRETWVEMELRDKFSPEKRALATYAERRKDPPPSFRTLIRDFCDYTSAHGFGRINASRHWISTIFWILLCVAAVTMTTVHLHMLYKKYQSRPRTTLVEIETATVRIVAISMLLILAEFGQFLFK